MEYKALVFDFFGVLCSEVAPPWFHEHFPNRGHSLKDELMYPADRGEVSQENLFIQLAKLSGISAKEIEEDWIKRAAINTELLNFIKEFKSLYKLGILSNSMSPYFHTITEDLGLDEIFDEIIISSEIGHTKPEPEAYQAVLTRLNVLPSETLLIDDNTQYINGAGELGIDGYIFISNQDLQLDLKNEFKGSSSSRSVSPI
ncbi:MAG: HAD-IA family hydrolase [Candidatus Colwellbacteria bacterium]|nr:HAD-IA family hydrolase [Candidatus Colwellbacteria bacterium]